MVRRYLVRGRRRLDCRLGITLASHLIWLISASFPDTYHHSGIYYTDKRIAQLRRHVIHESSAMPRQWTAPLHHDI